MTNMIWSNEICRCYTKISMIRITSKEAAEPVPIIPYEAQERFLKALIDTRGQVDEVTDRYARAVLLQGRLRRAAAPYAYVFKLAWEIVRGRYWKSSSKVHGGANQEVMEMLADIHASGEKIDHYINEAMKPGSTKRLSGFGHRIYKTYDPRAKVLKEAFHKLVHGKSKFRGNAALLEIALRLEERALKEDFFISRKLYPNVDFYSGLIYKGPALVAECAAAIRNTTN